MNIYCNSESIDIDAKTSLDSFLVTKDYSSKKGIAVAVNNKVIKRHEWATNILQENDKIVIISATKGG